MAGVARMNSTLWRLLLIVGWLLATNLVAASASWKAGMAKANITPSEPIWLAGYGSRTHPADGTFMELWIKVLALEDSTGKRAIVLTSDTLGIPQSIYTNVCAGAKQKFGLEPEQLMLSASHTHSGPVL